MVIWILVIGQLQLLGDKISNTYRCFHYSPRCFGIANVLLLIMGVAVFKSGVVKDPSFFGLFHALSDPSMMSNGILKNVAKTGILSTLFAVALLASGQNSTIAGTLTGQVVMEGFIHMRMPLWARRLVTRII